MDDTLLRFVEARFQSHTEDSLAAYIEAVNISSTDLLLGICRIEDDEHIGNIKLGPISSAHLHAAIGLLVGERRYWGQGYATEAIRGLSEYAFKALRLNKLFAGCYASNEASRRAFLRAGYVEEGRFSQHWQLNGVPEDGIQLGCTRDVWLASGGC